jgi:hypothetical protein
VNDPGCPYVYMMNMLREMLPDKDT